MFKKRLDFYLTERQLTDSRQKAKRLILEGKVFVNGVKVCKPAFLVNKETGIELKNTGQTFVGRGGLKLAGALKKFNLSVKGLTALDIGASTGGFTDCLLQNGIKKVYAVDVGKEQLARKIRTDPRVVAIDKKNARYFKVSDTGEKVDLAVIDLSFISIKLVLCAIISVVNKGGHIIALIKPQFDIGKGGVGKGGIVKDMKKHIKVLKEITRFATDAGLFVLGITRSTITGSKGNIEYFFHFALSY